MELLSIVKANKNCMLTFKDLINSIPKDFINEPIVDRDNPTSCYLNEILLDRDTGLLHFQMVQEEKIIKSYIEGIELYE